MSTYHYRMPWGETLTISADLTQAAAPICYLVGDDEDDDNAWSTTPYQTADARHRQSEMLRLVIEYLGASWYADPSIDQNDADGSQLAAAVAGAQEISE